MDTQLGTLCSSSESDEEPYLLPPRNTPPLTQIDTSILPQKLAANKTVEKAEEEVSKLNKKPRETTLLGEDTLDYLLNQARLSSSQR